MDNMKYSRSDRELLAGMLFNMKMKAAGITDQQEVLNKACFLMSVAQEEAEKYKKQARRWKAVAISVILIGVLAVSVIAGLWYASENGAISLPTISSPDRNPTPSSTTKAPANPDSGLRIIAYKNGQIIKHPNGKQLCPLEVSVRGNEAYYIYLDHTINPANDMSFMVEKNGTTEVSVPLGTYEIYYACGDTWYGTTHKFGSKTVYNKCDGTFHFYEDGEYYQGYTLELYLQSNGNLDTDEIPESQFPG